MGLTASEVYKLAARYGPKKVHEQSQQLARFMEEKIEILDVPGEVGYVTVKAGGLESTGWIADNATLPAGGSVDPTQVYYTPKYLFTRLSLPRGGIDLVRDVKDGVRLIMEEIETATADVARQIGRSLFTNDLGSPAGSVSAGDSSFTVSDVSGFREGVKIDVYNGATYIETVAIDYIDWSTTPYTVHLTDVTTASWTTSYTLYLRGSKSNGVIPLKDVASGSASLYSLAATTNEWSGNTDSTTTTLSETAMRALHDKLRVRRGMPCTCVVMSPTMLTRYLNLHTGFRQFTSAGYDFYGKQAGPTFDGIPIFVDDNMPEDMVLFFQRQDAKLHRFKKFGPEGHGVKPGRDGLSNAIVSQTSFSYDVQMWQAAEMRVTRRNGMGAMTAIDS